LYHCGITRIIMKIPSGVEIATYHIKSLNKNSTIV
jgi:hypothetical protein